MRLYEGPDHQYIGTVKEITLSGGHTVGRKDKLSGVWIEGMTWNVMPGWHQRNFVSQQDAPGAGKHWEYRVTKWYMPDGAWALTNAKITPPGKKGVDWTDYDYGEAQLDRWIAAENTGGRDLSDEDLPQGVVATFQKAAPIAGGVVLAVAVVGLAWWMWKQYA